MTIMKWSAMVAGIALIAGCVTLGPDTQSQSAIEQSLKRFKKSLEHKDVDALMELYSASYKDERLADKSAVRAFVENAVKDGHLNAAHVNVSDAEIAMADGRAMVYPLKLEAPQGNYRISLEFAKEDDGIWRIVDSEIQNL